MKARCGLEDCDCEYTIEKLLGALRRAETQCTAGLHPAVDKDEVFRAIAHDAQATLTRLEF